jgi:hypothetical protein
MQISGRWKRNARTKELSTKGRNKTGEAEPGEASDAEEGSDAQEENDETGSGPFWQQDVSTIKSWKKSIIPFAQNQTRDVTIHFKARYAENDESVSDDSHISGATFAYSLSPASTWKGPIGKGKIEINILHPEPEDVSIEKPKERFKKISDTRYEWDFENLKPAMAGHPHCCAFKIRFRPDMAKKTLAAAHRMFSGTINIFSITPITMRRQARHWQPRANTITTSLT